MEITKETHSKPIENETFWKNHYELLKSSGISRVEYCRKHNLNYDRFGYWISRWNRFTPTENNLVSVKLKTASQTTTQSVLCTLELKNGCSIKIHDTHVFSIILEKFL